MSQPLPGMPVPPPREVKASPAGERLSRYCGRRRLCDLCVRAIHRLGVGKAPYPQPAKWRATSGNFDTYLCYAHKDDR